MKKKHVVVLAMLVAGTGSIFAQCTTPYENGVSVQSILSGKTVCVAGSKPGWGGWEHQEYHALVTTHNTPVSLVELHAGTTADPEETVGTWAYSNTGRVTHTYTGGGAYTYDIKNSSGAYYFCPGNIPFTTRGGKTRC